MRTHIPAEEADLTERKLAARLWATDRKGIMHEHENGTGWQWGANGACPALCTSTGVEGKSSQPTPLWPVKKPHKKTKPQTDSPKLVKAIRKEITRRTEILQAERAKFPPTLTKRGKPNRKFTRAMRDHMHTFAFTAEQVRADLIKKGMK
jgi:hypothetical protein